MQKKPSFFIYFLIFFILSIVIFLFSNFGFLKPVEPFFHTLTAPIQGVFYSGFSFVAGFGANSKIKELENKNSLLTKQLIDQNKLVKDNKALNDQFQIQNPRSDNLIPAQVIGAPGFIPGFSVPESYVIDRGVSDGIKVGDAVIVNDNLIGRIAKVSSYISSVMLISNSNFLVTASTLETGAQGVLKGQGGGGLILDNVVLSDSLRVGDIVISKGNVNELGSGIIPNLILGEIVAVNKNPSDLFQRAKINSRIDFTKVYKVFVVNY